jgi:outer membrane protein OmpA-like peptidoglycan-associated protein
MRFAFATAPAIIAAMVMGGCAQFGAQPHPDSRPVSWSNSPQPIEPEALHPSGRLARNDLVVLLPKLDGPIGGVVVRTEDGQKILLDKPYAGAQINGPGAMQPVTYDAARAEREFSPVVAALPARPATFLVYFLEGNDELTAESEREIERVFAEIAARPYPEILVIGHTDAVGNTPFNDQLSRQRARRVRDDLIKRGTSPDRIEVSARGMREPLVPTSQGVSEPRNRRVEINVR